MKLKSLISVILTAIAVIVSSCSNSPYDKAVNYIDELSAEVKTVTTEIEFDKVYNKIVNINSNGIMTCLSDLSREQKQVIIQKMANL